MPEGPEIRRVADRLGRQLVGKPLESVWFAFPELEGEGADLEGRQVMAVESWGKALLIYFDNDRVMYSHNQLYGVWKLHRAGRSPSTRRSLRVQLQAGGRTASLYSASDVSLWQSDQVQQHPFLSRLGPDLLSHGVSVNDIEERLATAKFRRRALGGLLLDQGFYAGIGNYLRSEMLFFAGVAPQRRPMDLDDSQRSKLATVILDVIQQAYHQAGVTNRPAWIEREKRAGATRGRWRFAVFGRDGLACHACSNQVSRRMVTSRRLYYCPNCQSS
ncbi:endonuclease VIII [Onishia niordana]|uniref:endonuclease VIII n=1 Tax=Onishia niordana TaxID=2508711 RepID=UPI00109F71B8|nr:endonuclease VIII [Halomonas niordiana]